MFSIEVPSSCPACNGEVRWDNDLLYCANAECSAKSAKRIEHFVKTLKIKGLGPRTLEKLQLESLSELFEFSETDLAEAIGSEKVAAKVFSEIKNAEKAPANIVLPAFGIPLIGKTASEKLSTVCDSIFDISSDSCAKAGLGPKATESLMTWMDTEFIEVAVNLPFSYEFERSTKSTSREGVVCITGKLNSVKTKAEAIKLLEAAGYEVKSSLTNQVTILLNESDVESAKTKKARSNGVEIVTKLSTLIGD